MKSFDILIAIHEMLWPETNLQQQLAKYEEEQQEYKETLYHTEEGLYEIADMVIVSAGIARFDYTRGVLYLTKAICDSEFDIVDIWQAVGIKMRKNMKRDWVKKADVGYHHTEEGE